MQNSTKCECHQCLLLECLRNECRCFPRVLPGGKLPGERNYSQFVPVHADRLEPQPADTEIFLALKVACVSLTDNFWPHAAVPGIWARQRGSTLTACRIFSPQVRVSNCSFRSPSGLGRFRLPWFYAGAPPLFLSVAREPEVSAVAADVPKSPRSLVTTSPRWWLSKSQSLSRVSCHKRSKAPKEECVGKYLCQNIHRQLQHINTCFRAN